MWTGNVYDIFAYESMETLHLVLKRLYNRFAISAPQLPPVLSCAGQRMVGSFSKFSHLWIRKSQLKISLLTLWPFIFSLIIKSSHATCLTAKFVASYLLPLTISLPFQHTVRCHSFTKRTIDFLSG